MTQSEFLEDLKKYANNVQWNLYRGGELRTLNGKHCPISFVAWKKAGCGFSCKHPISAAKYIYLWEDDVCDIIMAADHKCESLGTTGCKKLRQQLIEITNPLQTVDA